MATSASSGLLSTLPQELPLEFLKEITNAFSDERKISDGAFGTVYKVWFGVHFFLFLFEHAGQLCIIAAINSP